jgi:hypothetical protein
MTRGAACCHMSGTWLCAVTVATSLLWFSMTAPPGKMCSKSSAQQQVGCDLHSVAEFTCFHILCRSVVVHLVGRTFGTCCMLYL